MTEATVETLWDRDGRSPYQARVKCGRFRVLIFWRGDRDPDAHDHPADFWTFPLVGYMEEVRAPDGSRWINFVRPFRLHRRRAEYAHRVIQASWPGIGRPIVTLGWWGKKRREWGFWTDQGWVHWEAYVNTREGARC